MAKRPVTSLDAAVPSSACSTGSPSGRGMQHQTIVPTRSISALNVQLPMSPRSRLARPPPRDVEGSIMSVDEIMRSLPRDVLHQREHLALVAQKQRGAAFRRRLDPQREHARQVQSEDGLVGVVVTYVEDVAATRLSDQRLQCNALVGRLLRQQ